MALFNIFGRASGLIRYMLLVGFLSDSQYGLITFALSFGKLGRTLMDSGLDNLVSRDGARDHQKVPAFYLHALAIKGFFGVVSYLIAYLYLHSIRGQTWGELTIVFTALVGSLMLSLTGVIRSCFTAIERMEYIFYTNLPVRLISIFLLFIALWFSLPLFYSVAAISLENVLWFILLGSVSLRFFSVSRIRLSRSTLRYMFSESWSLALYGFFTVFYLSLDVIMIEYMMGGTDAVAPYTYAGLLMEGVTMLLTGYIIAVYPVFSRLHVTDDKGYQRLFKQSVIVLTACTIPLSVLLFFWADGWMNWIKPTGPLSGRILRILSFNLVVTMLNTLITIVFTSRNRQRRLIFFTGFAVTISFLTNWWLIPIYAQPGAAYATLLSQLIMFAVMSAAARRLFALRFPVRKPLAIAMVSLLAGGITWLIPGVPLLAVPFLFGVWLLLFVRLFGVLSPLEMRQLLNAVKP